MHIDPQLLKACVKQDRKAQNLLYKQCFGVLMGVCIRYYRQEEEAASVLNLGFLKILQNLDKRKAKVPFEAWIRRIMINTIIDEYRKNKRHQQKIRYEDLQEPHLQASKVDFNEADRQFDAAELEALIRRLPPVSREVFNLFAIDGYTHKEISDMLGISKGTSKWHVSFARKQLKGWLSEKMTNLITK
ncbi:MAG: RNA polymerase sigma factor [Bacteroidota bacterium]